MSPAFIGPEVFRMTGQEMPVYYKLLNEVRQQLPGLSKNVLTGASDDVLTGLSASQQELLNDYRMVEYDMLEGDDYARDLLF
ncbi:hypothetical protein D3C73_1400400 [compost metagenome]